MGTDSKHRRDTRREREILGVAHYAAALFRDLTDAQLHTLVRWRDECRHSDHHPPTCVHAGEIDQQIDDICRHLSKTREWVALMLTTYPGTRGSGPDGTAMVKMNWRMPTDLIGLIRGEAERRNVTDSELVRLILRDRLDPDGGS